MDKVDWNAEFSSIIGQNKPHLYEICKLSMRLIEEHTESAQEGFQYFLTKISLPRYNADEIPDGLLVVDEDEIDLPTQKRIREMESQIVRELIFQDVSEKTFYTEIWKRISDKLLVSDSYQKSFFLFRMWLDPRVPYYQLGLGLSMDNETYKENVRQLALPYKKMTFAMNAGYPQRTQKISVLMKIAEEIPTQEKRIVFWSLAFWKMEKQIEKLRQQIQELKQKIQDLESIFELDDAE